MQDFNNKIYWKANNQNVARKQKKSKRRVPTFCQTTFRQ